jgi:hypothetical protein
MTLAVRSVTNSHICFTITASRSLSDIDTEDSSVVYDHMDSSPLGREPAPMEGSLREQALELLGQLLIIGAIAAVGKARPHVANLAEQAVSSVISTWNRIQTRKPSRPAVAAAQAAPLTETQRVVAELEATWAAMNTEEARNLFLAALVTRLFSEEQLKTLREARSRNVAGDLELQSMVGALTTEQLRSAITALLEEKPSFVDDRARAQIRKILGVSLDTAQPAGDVLSAGARLNPGDKLTSHNGRYTLVMQDDGNLVGYDGTQAFWDTGTWGRPGCYLTAEPSGRFTVMTPEGTVAWTRESGSSHGYLCVQDDRNIVIYSSSGSNPAAAWASNTNI